MTVAVQTQVIDIVVTGLTKTGKTALIDAICKDIDAVDNWHTGQVEIEAGLSAQFLEPPPMTKFDYLWLRDTIAEVAVPGFIVLCDSTRPDQFTEMFAILQTIRAIHPDTPIVVAANKQDLPDAWGADDIRLGLGIPADIPVVPCVATDPQQVKDVIIKLLYAIWEE
jgi:hypothetical protein